MGSLELLAFEYLKRAAKGGHAQAQFNLGLEYYYGSGFVNKNQDEGLDLIKCAADQQNEDALKFLESLKS